MRFDVVFRKVWLSCESRCRRRSRACCSKRGINTNKLAPENSQLRSQEQSTCRDKVKGQKSRGFKGLFRTCDKETIEGLGGANKASCGSHLQSSTILMRSSVTSSLITAILQKPSAYLFPFSCVDMVTTGCGMLTSGCTYVDKM